MADSRCTLFLFGLLSVFGRGVLGQCTGVAGTLKIALVTDTFFSERVQKAYNLNNGKGVKEIPSEDPSQCYRLETELVQLEARYRGLSDVYDPQVASTLNSSSMIVGTYDRSLYNFARKNDKFYFSTSPLPLSFERESNQPGQFFSIWPAESVYIQGTAAILNHMLGMKENRRVLFLHHTESMQGIEFVDALTRRIKTLSLSLYTYDLAREVEKFRGKTILEIRQSDGFYSYFKHLRKLLTMTKFRFVVLYLDLPTKEKMKMLDWFFQEEAELEDLGTDWLIADLTFPFEHHALAELRRYAITKPRVFYFAWDRSEELLDKCAIGNEYGEIENVALIQLYDILVKVTSEMPPGDFNMQFSQISGFNRRWCKSELELQMKPGTFEVLNFPKFPLFVMYERTPEREQPECGNVRTIFTGQSKMINMLRHESLQGMIWSGNYHTEYGLGGVPIVSEKTYAVVIQDVPFVSETREGSNEYEGLAMDILNAIKRILIMEGLELKLEIKKAAAYGSKSNGTWNGVLGAMQNDKHTVLGIGQITVTEERSADFDFTIPIGYSYETYLVQKQILSHQYFQFLRPFTTDVWLLMGLIMILSGFYLFGIDQWNPFKDEFPEGSEFNAEEGLWHSFLVITQAGAPFGAHTYPNRVYSIFYWFFALVVVGCYTGNLANFLIESATSVPNIDMYSLATSKHYRFGMLANTSVSTSFQNDPRLIRLWEKIVERNDFLSSYEEGLEKVREGNYVLFGTSLLLTYHHNHDENCMLSMHQPTFYDRRKSAAIAFPIRKDWVYKDRFKNAMERLRESGEMQLIYKRWMDSSASCQAEEEDEGHLRLDWHNFIGLLIILSIGTILSFVVLLVKLRHLSLKEKRPAEETCSEGENETSLEEQEATAV